MTTFQSPRPVISDTRPLFSSSSEFSSSQNVKGELGVRPEMERVYSCLNQLILGKPTQIKLSLTCLLANGHLLIDDLPGMGKTVLSNALARVLGFDYKRVQFTNDLLPADLLGSSIYEKEQSAFRFIQGPVFSQLLLADEINRASPKTQSALLEVMEERQVSLDGKTRPLPSPFFVIATQNPQEQLGTSALPESQLDRFMIRLSMGYPTRTAELEIFSGQSRRRLLEAQQALMSNDVFVNYQKQVELVECSAHVLEYLYELLRFTRQSNQFVNGVSTRGGLAVLQAAKAWAWLEGETILLPQHIQAVFAAVVGHRLQGREGNSSAELLGERILSEVSIPR